MERSEGVPENEIAFIHSANTDARKAKLFAKVTCGQVRFYWVPQGYIYQSSHKRQA